MSSERISDVVVRIRARVPVFIPSRLCFFVNDSAVLNFRTRIFRRIGIPDFVWIFKGSLFSNYFYWLERSLPKFIFGGVIYKSSGISFLPALTTMKTVGNFRTFREANLSFAFISYWEKTSFDSCHFYWLVMKMCEERLMIAGCKHRSAFCSHSRCYTECNNENRFLFGFEHATRFLNRFSFYSFHSSCFFYNNEYCVIFSSHW